MTGGASGIGASTVSLFRDHGAKVVIADVQDDLGQTLANNLGPDDVSYVHCDVTDDEQVRALVDAAVSRFGRLDIMHSNAGIMPAELSGNIRNTDKDALQRILGVNLVGAFLAAKHAARVMVPTKKGCIIFTASACTETAGIAEHGYVASKYGIVGLTKNLAAELGASGIRVNCVSPFGVLARNQGDDEMKKMMFESLMSEVGNLKGNVLKVEDIANAALYLGSDEARCVSGVNLVVDGGYSIVNPTLANVLRMGGAPS